MARFKITLFIFVLTICFIISVAEARTVEIVGIDNVELKQELGTRFLDVLKNQEVDKVAELLQNNTLEIDHDNTTDDVLVLRRITQSEVDFLLYEAVSKNDINESGRLLQNPSVNVDALNGNENVKWTPLIVAAHHGYYEIAKLLVEHGADLDLTDSGAGNQTALAYAINQDRLDIVKLLIEKGVSLEQKAGKEMETPLSVAADQSKYQIAKYLLDQGADANARGRRGMTPLFLAMLGSGDENEKVVLELIKYTDPNIKSEPYKKWNWDKQTWGPEIPPYTAFYLAIRTNRSQAIIDALIKAGARRGDSSDEKYLIAKGLYERSNALLKEGKKEQAMKAYDDIIEWYSDVTDDTAKWAALALTAKYELSLTTGRPFSQEHKQNLAVFAKTNSRINQSYEMLKIVEGALTENQDEAVESWQKKFGSDAMTWWEFTEIENWATNLKDEAAKDRVFAYLENFRGR